MRTEREMLDLILNTARADERIRAVLLNGSRVDPTARRDVFQDFDVVYLVTDVAPFKEDAGWHKRFGEIMVMQTPEDMVDPAPENHGGYVYLMQFKDGNRIDLGLYPTWMAASLTEDSLTLVLLDKDKLIPRLPPPSEKGYLPKPPTAKEYLDCCNEFWWCAPYVAKGLWRGQITYAKGMLELALRQQLLKMLAWYVSLDPACARNPGYLGKHLQDCLEPRLWEMLMKTYSGAGYDETWEALGAMVALFRHAATAVAGHYELEYPSGDDERASAHLRHVRTLPRDALQMY